VSQHTLNRQQILTIALSTFNQYGDTFTLDQLAARLSGPPSILYPYFGSKPELIRQLVSFILDRVRQPPPELLHHSLADELRDVLATYHELFTAFSQTALFDLKLLYPKEWDSILELRESQWQRIAAIIPNRYRQRPAAPYRYQPGASDG
jgi:AcrR family transcriptional regulator